MRWYETRSAQQLPGVGGDASMPLRLVNDSLESDVEEEWRDEYDHGTERHYTRGTGLVSGTVTGTVTIEGRFVVPAGEDPTAHIEYMIENDTPPVVVRAVEKHTGPASWGDDGVRVTVKAKVLSINYSNGDAYDARVQVGIEADVGYYKSDYGRPDYE